MHGPSQINTIGTCTHGLTIVLELKNDQPPFFRRFIRLVRNLKIDHDTGDGEEDVEAKEEAEEEGEMRLDAGKNAGRLREVNMVKAIERLKASSGDGGGGGGGSGGMTNKSAMSRDRGGRNSSSFVSTSSGTSTGASTGNGCTSSSATSFSGSRRA